jgi:hypothetical protein
LRENTYYVVELDRKIYDIYAQGGDASVGDRWEKPKAQNNSIQGFFAIPLKLPAQERLTLN